MRQPAESEDGEPLELESEQEGDQQSASDEVELTHNGQQVASRKSP